MSARAGRVQCGVPARHAPPVSRAPVSGVPGVWMPRLRPRSRPPRPSLSLEIARTLEGPSAAREPAGARQATRSVPRDRARHAAAKLASTARQSGNRGRTRPRSAPRPWRVVSSSRDLPKATLRNGLAATLIVLVVAFQAFQRPLASSRGRPKRMFHKEKRRGSGADGPAAGLQAPQCRDELRASTP